MIIQGPEAGLSNQENTQNPEYEDTRYYIEHSLPEEFRNLPELQGDITTKKLAEFLAKKVREYIADTFFDQHLINYLNAFLNEFEFNGKAYDAPTILLHSIAVAFIARDFCQDKQIGTDEFYPRDRFSPQEAFVACLTHDYGKLDAKIKPIVNNSHPIWNGNSNLHALSLTPEKWRLIRQHPIVGANKINPLLRKFGVDKRRSRLILDACLYHQQYWCPSSKDLQSQKSYPNKKMKRNQIPLIDRVCILVDSYCAGIDPFRKFYQNLSSPEQMIKTIRQQSGPHFDSHLVGQFVEWLEAKLNITELEKEVMEIETT